MDERQLSSWPWIISVLDSKGYCRIVMFFLCMFDNNRSVTFFVVSSICFELVADKQTV